MVKEGLFRGKSVMSAEKMEYHNIPHDNGWVKGFFLDGYICGQLIEVNEEYIAPEWWCKVDPETVEHETKKQIPKKPVYARHFYCPCCTSRVGGKDASGVYGKNYCSRCGQAIDWTEWED